MKATIILSFIIAIFGFFTQVSPLQDSEDVWLKEEQVKNLLWTLQEIKLKMKEIAKEDIDDDNSKYVSSGLPVMSSYYAYACARARHLYNMYKSYPTIRRL